MRDKGHHWVVYLHYMDGLLGFYSGAGAERLATMSDMNKLVCVPVTLRLSSVKHQLQGLKLVCEGRNLSLLAFY